MYIMLEGLNRELYFSHFLLLFSLVFAAAQFFYILKKSMFCKTCFSVKQGLAYFWFIFLPLIHHDEHGTADLISYLTMNELNQ